MSSQTQGYQISRVESTIVDLPIRRKHTTGAMAMEHQSSVILEIHTAEGLVGIGEATVPGGGPGWGGESVESMKQIIDHHLAPALLSTRFHGLNDAVSLAVSAFRGASFALAGIEMALHDLHGKRHDLSIAEMFGGLVHDRLPVLWSIGANVESLLTESLSYVEAGHRTIKFMLGSGDPPTEVRRVVEVIGHLPDDVVVTVDCNGRWDESTARQLLPPLAEAGVQVAEQPVPAWDLGACQRLRGLGSMKIMADESVQSVRDLMRVIQAASADLVAVKVPKFGGLSPARSAITLADVAGLGFWAGGTMESSVGTAAAAQLFGTYHEIAGCDLVGPLLMTADVVTESVRYVDGALVIPRGPGLGVDLDRDKVRHYARR